MDLNRYAFTDAALYLVIDLFGGPDAECYPVRYSTVPPDLNDDTCRTTELWFRLVQPDTFMMGSPPCELGHRSDETLHMVTLTKPFYMGVFQVTQKQYELVTGEANPSKYKGDTRPVGHVSYSMIRGGEDGTQWPTHNLVDAASFFGKLRAKTSLTADLPTEAQWEYACRAGTRTALNSGKDLTGEDQCPNMTEVGRYFWNMGDGKGGYSDRNTKGGMYLPNAWGLYDMHGNVWEWCLDGYQENLGQDEVTDPKGAATAQRRVLRGGGYFYSASYCRAACRNYDDPDGMYHNCGFRACVLPAEEKFMVAAF